MGEGRVIAGGEDRGLAGGAGLERLGLLEWLRPGEHARVEALLEALGTLGVERLRTGISWADYDTAAGRRWYDWLLPRLSDAVEVLPCFAFTPPSLGEAPHPAAPPRDPRAFADFVEAVLAGPGRALEWVELWNEPNDLRSWDRRLDPGLEKQARLLGGAAERARGLGRRVVLGGMNPIDPEWLELMFARGVMAAVDVVGVHGFPEVDPDLWGGWASELTRAREVLERHGSDAALWVTETGRSTADHSVLGQAEALLEALAAPVDRVYWHGFRDRDEREVAGDPAPRRRVAALGLETVDGRPKLLLRLWRQRGLDAVREAVSWANRPRLEVRDAPRPALITGGAGFVGANLTRRLASEGRPVVVYDDLSRPGVEANARWLLERYGERLRFVPGDVRDRRRLDQAVRGVGPVFHLAAQVAVTTSLVRPREDFDVNAGGTQHLLDALRASGHRAGIVFTSTNKVYGDLGDLELRTNGTRYEPVADLVRARGVDESRSLDLHSPYGCSKGAADQYVLEYARTFGLPAVVFRMSCIYGPRQFGTVDQGWVSQFVLSGLRGEPLTIFGDGKQVRDVLYVDDLVEAFLLASGSIEALSGSAFNIGGGPDNVLSLLDLLGLMQELDGARPQVCFDEWRPGDQRYYVSDTTRFREATGWRPRVSPPEGVRRLSAWLREFHGLARPAEAGRRVRRQAS